MSKERKKQKKIMRFDLPNGAAVIGIPPDPGVYVGKFIDGSLVFEKQPDSEPQKPDAEMPSSK